MSIQLQIAAASVLGAAAIWASRYRNRLHLSAPPRFEQQLLDKELLRVLLVSHSTVQSFQQGFRYVERDLLVAGLPKAIDACVKYGVRDAFCIRVELVNYKKVIFHNFLECLHLQKELKRGSALLHCKRSEVNDEKLRDFLEISRSMFRCKGVYHILTMARVYLKLICCVPRYIDEEIQPELQAMPANLPVFAKVKHFRKFIEATDKVALGGTHESFAEKAGRRLDAIVLKIVNEIAPAPSTRTQQTTLVKKILIARGAYKALLIQDVFEVYSQAMDTALAALVATAPVIAGLAADCREHRSSGTKPSRKACFADREEVNLSGIVVALQDHCKWCNQIRSTNTTGDGPAATVSIEETAADEAAAAGVAPPPSRLFKASNDSIGMVPEGYHLPLLLEEHKSCALRFRTRLERLSEEEWEELLAPLRRESPLLPQLPSKATQQSKKRGKKEEQQQQKAIAAGRNVCVWCKGSFASIAVDRNVCCKCEFQRRRSLRCPFSDTCGSSKCRSTDGTTNNTAFCPHSRMCFHCEAWSCGECRLVRNDGDGTGALFQQLRTRGGSDTSQHPPLSALFLDFDQTFCTTKSGGPPHLGRHTLQPELLGAVLQLPTRTVIVTRNQHTAEIRQFLDAMRVPPTVVVQRCLPHQTKASVITAHLDVWAAQPDKGCKDNGLAMFVDDDINELTSFTPEQAAGVFRVHFAEGTPKW
jgi:hypothetical protein